MQHKWMVVFTALVLLSLSIAPVGTAQAHAALRPLYAIGDLAWAKSMGGFGSESAVDIAIDSNGNIYTTGIFRDTADFDPGAGTFNLTPGGSYNVFVSKLDNNGDFIWAKSLGGDSVEESTSIAVDSNGNICITGTFQGTSDFDPGPGTYNLTSFGRYDIFVAKLDGNGNFVWAKSVVGTDYFSDERGSGIAVDSNGNVYVTGNFRATVDFDPGPGTANLTSAGSDDIFVSKLDSSGNFIWAKNMGGTGFDKGISIDVDTNGNVYTTGEFEGPADFDPGAGTFNLIGTDVYSWFVSKLNSNGDFVWAKATGGFSLQADPDGNVYIGGQFGWTFDFDPDEGIFNMTSAGSADAFLAKLDSNGDFLWAKRMGGVGFDFARDIVLDTSNSVYVTGWFEGTVDFDPGPGLFNLTPASMNTEDVFIVKLDTTGHFHWAKDMGGVGTDYGNGIALDATGNVYTTGTFDFTADFDPNVGVFNLTSAGSQDVFISKLQNSPVGGDITPPSVVSITASATPTGSSSVDFNVAFSEPVLEVDANDFTLDISGNTTGAAITNVTGSGSTRSVTVNTGSGIGTLHLTVPASATITDMTGNSIPSLAFTGGETYTILEAATFSDVETGYWAWQYVERLVNAGITAGCGGGQYCPEATVTRAQMAVFLERGMHGSSYTPPPVGGSTGFGDVSTSHWAGAWIKQLAADGITGGCGGGNYCSESPVTRAQMAVFLLRAKHGASYSPSAVGNNTGFGDVQSTHWAAAWIKQLVAEGITSGCGNGNYCPESPVTRAQMAVFLVKTFNLP